ncbi:MAG: Fic family protein [Anderseniella sp.]|jgi:cell filamentation protein|nr:Fic family protein [Anderseniella sp.]
MTEGRYSAHGIEAEFEPGSRGRVLRNKLGIVRVREMQQAESDALLAVHEWAAGHFNTRHRFTTQDICRLHRQWLGDIYAWAGEFRHINLSKDGFLFASADQVPRLMAAFEHQELAQETPCAGMAEPQLVKALARTHSELLLIHPFREGNGRCARLLAWLMALQAGLPALEFSPLARRGKPAYIAAVHAAMDGDYAAMEQCFSRVIRQTWRIYGGRRV